MSKKKAKKEEFSIDDLQEEESSITPDEAAMRSESYEFKGKKLEAFSQQRQVAADAMDVKVCTPEFPSIAKRLMETSSYPGMWADAQKVVWLCTQPLSAAFKAVRDADSAVEESMKWAAKNKITIGSNLYMELMQTFGNMIEDVWAVQAQAESTGKGSGKNQSLGE